MGNLSTKHLEADLKGRSVRGGALIATSQGSQLLLQFIFTVVLARLLTPSDFGLVAMVTAVTGLGQAFADLGLSEATIQSPEISQNQVSALFWINSVIGLGLTLITMAMAPVLAWFYREPQLVAITLVLSPTFIIGGLRVQPDAILKRQMRYKVLALRDVIGYTLGVFVAVAMALRGAGYWSIVAFPLTVNFSAMVLSWLMVHWRPSLPRRGANVRSMVTFGGHVAAAYFVGSLTSNAANILIGWYWAAGPLGLYSKAYSLVTKPVTQIITPVGNIAINTLSRIQHDPERFARYYLRATNLMMWMSAPLFGFLFVAAKPVIIVTLGNKWLGAAPVFQLLSISALAQPLLQSANWLLVSSGRSDRLLKLCAIAAPVTIVSVVVGLPFGIKGVALSSSLVLLGALPFMLHFAFRGMRLTLPQLGRAILCPVSLSLVAVVFSESVLHFTAPGNDLLALLVATLSFSSASLLMMLAPPVRREIVSFKAVLGDLRLSRQSVRPPAQRDAVAS